jgi:thioredoxin-like negative regulator of GroEL
MNNLANQRRSKLLVAWWDMNSQETRHNLTAVLLDMDRKTKDIHQGITGTPPSSKTSQVSRRSQDNNTAARYKSARESEDLQRPINNMPDNHLARFDRMNHLGHGQTTSPSRCSAVSTLVSSKR